MKYLFFTTLICLYYIGTAQVKPNSTAKTSTMETTTSASPVAQNKKTVDNFFVALETENFELLKTVFAPQGRQLNPYVPEGFPKSFDGSEAIYKQYSSLPQMFGQMKFPRTIYGTEDPNTFFVRFKGLIDIKAGGRYENDYLGVFKLRNSRITEYTEYFNPLVMAKAFGIPLSKAPEIRKVSFNSEGNKLIGNVYYPTNYEKGKTYPAVIVTGSWTTVKEQMAGLYAQKLADRGYITFAFDFSGFGESEGAPRYYENPERKVKDIKNAVSYLQTVEGVNKDNLALLGVCASSGYDAIAATQDKRVKALVTVAAWLHDEEAVKLIYGGENGVQTRINEAKKAKQDFAANGTLTFIPSISKTDKSAAMYGDYDYYLNANRGAIPQWSAAKFNVMSWEDWLTYNPMPVAKNLHIPVLMVHSDGAVLPDYAKRFFNDIPVKDKQLYWTEGSQFDFYDQPKQVTEAVREADKFFKSTLK